ncbi:iron-containing alcohol dehydrogenase [Paenibacillus agricola]|uniref:Iron-containing alcohol dehydrogenase n=1 Tax=Paenibacillus agricola TaxID=2716264 RepID=A0ABX0J8E8_9BACL|nr:iron-containing alcohol dehydrogenase [Paenibacillus agricola]NHN31878.1 iron-containing alcohol dehydrogenase [Paenibacillus agricola]
MDFKYVLPTTVECGLGIARKIGEILKARQVKRVFIVTDTGVRQAGCLDPIEQSLKDQGVKYDIFDETEPNPSEGSIKKGLDALKGTDADHVLAVGGGSSIDTAKAIAIMAQNKGNILDYEGVGKLPKPGLPLVVIPTTAGTGSEVTASTIITNSETQFKTAIISPYLFPQLALLDAEITRRLPADITASTGMDALTHAIESYVSKGATPISRAFALQAMELIGKHLPKAYFVGDDIDSREQMLVASMMAGAAFAQSRLGNVHAISHTLGGIFNIPHGVANAVLLPYVMRFNLPACPEKMKDIACALGEDVAGLSVTAAAERAIEVVVLLNESLGIPKTIKELGVTLDQLGKMVEDSMRSGNVLINPRLTKANDIKKIIENAYTGITN